MRLRSSWRTLSACFRYRCTGEVLFIIPQAEKYATAPGATRTFAPSSSWRGVVANTTAVIYNLYSYHLAYFIFFGVLSRMRVRRITIRLNIPEWMQHAAVAALLVGAAVAVFCAARPGARGSTL